MTDLDERWTDVAARLREIAADVPVPHGSLMAVERRARRRDRNRVAVLAGCGVATLGIAIAALVDGDDGATTIVDGSGVSTSTEATPTDPSLVDTTVTSTGPTPLEPSVRTMIESLDHPLRRGDTGEVVALVQGALEVLGYDSRGTSGTFDDATEQAVLAFEGLALERPWQQQTGQLTVDEIVRLLEGDFARPAPLRDGTDHTEILLDRQVIVVYRDGAAAFIAHISSGSGELWCETQTVDVDAKGQPLPEATTRDVCGIANTPGGVFQFYRTSRQRVAGDYGAMANPVYFNYGIAVYGAFNVPPQPVSHGGVRIPIDRSAAFADLVAMKEYVYVFDGETEPEDVTRDHSLPTFVYPNPG